MLSKCFGGLCTEISMCFLAISFAQLQLSPTRDDYAAFCLQVVLTNSVSGDSFDLLPYLHLLFRDFTKSGIIIDVGASIGDFSGAIAQGWGDLERAWAEKHVLHKVPQSSLPTLLIYALEPSPRYYDILRQRAELNKWTSVARFHAMQLAAGDADGWSTLFGCEVERGDHCNASSCPEEWVENHCSLSPEASQVKRFRGNNAQLKEVNVSTARLDTLYYSAVEPTILPHRRAGIFILKIDCEGHDFRVLRGAERLLERKVPKYIVFEYSDRWRMDGMKGSLQGTVSSLESAGYSCWIIATSLRMLVPLSATPVWIRVLQAAASIGEINIVCGQASDMAPLVGLFTIGSGMTLQAAQYRLTELVGGTAVEKKYSRLSWQPALKLGNKYLYNSLGDGVMANFSVAKTLFDIAARSGEPEALFRLAVMHHYGMGIPRHLGRAFSLYHQVWRKRTSGKGFANVAKLMLCATGAMTRSCNSTFGPL